jgi:DNA-binding transcriptional ArsR family regulator
MTLGRGPLMITGMATNPPSLCEIAALVGSPARANMLTALLDGRALTASELAYAGVAPQTASEHLAKLKEGHLLSLVPGGRIMARSAKRARRGGGYADIRDVAPG